MTRVAYVSPVVLLSPRKKAANTLLHLSHRSIVLATTVPLVVPSANAVVTTKAAKDNSLNQRK
jgi:hypothetical protein